MRILPSPRLAGANEPVGGALRCVALQFCYCNGSLTELVEADESDMAIAV